MLKKLFKPFLILLLVIPFCLFIIVPVNAENEHDYDTLEPWQVLAYTYWNRLGFNLISSVANNTTISGTISEPSYRINTGDTSYRYQCNQSGTSYVCYYVNNAGSNIGTFEYETVAAHSDSVSLTDSGTFFTGYTIPWLSGTYIHDTTHVNNQRDILLPANGSVYMGVVSSVNFWNSSDYAGGNALPNRYANVYSRDGSSGFQVHRFNSSEIVGAYYQVFRIDNPNNSNAWVSVDFPKITNSTTIIPIYLGSGNDIPDSVKQSLGIMTGTEQYLSEISDNTSNLAGGINQVVVATSQGNSLIANGNSTSAAATNNLSNQNNELSSTVSQINSLETTYNDSLNLALNNISTSNELVQHTGFTNAALWVSAQFNRLVVNTPFELIITFSMVTGLALVLIGKMRG